MATEYTLRRADGRPFGSFAQVQALIRRLFPVVEFGWTTSGPEKIRQAAEHGIELPPQLREAVEKLPSLLEGAAEGEATTSASAWGTRGRSRASTSSPTAAARNSSAGWRRWRPRPGRSSR